MKLWDSNLSKQNLSLFLSFFLSQISEELERNCTYPLERKENVNKGKLKRYHWENMANILRKKLNICCEVEHTQRWLIWHRKNEEFIDEKCEWERAKERNETSKSYPPLHTPTPKQISVRKSHKSPHISSYEWGTLTLFLTPYIFDCHVSTVLDESVHTLHWSIPGSPVKRSLRERRIDFKKMKFFLPFPSLSLFSLSLSYQLLSHYLSSLSSLFCFGPLSQYMQSPSMKESLTNWKVIQTPHVFMMRHTENAKHTEMEGREREWKKMCGVCICVFAFKTVRVCMWAVVYACVSVRGGRKRENEREREWKKMCRVGTCVFAFKTAWVCVWAFVWRVRWICVWERERERLCAWECVRVEEIEREWEKLWEGEEEGKSIVTSSLCV